MLLAIVTIVFNRIFRRDKGPSQFLTPGRYRRVPCPRYLVTQRVWPPSTVHLNRAAGRIHAYLMADMSLNPSKPDGGQLPFTTTHKHIHTFSGVYSRTSVSRK